MDVAVILLPGILGSPLMSMNDQKVVWPVHDKNSIVFGAFPRDTLEKAASFADLFTFKKHSTALLAGLDNRTKNVASIYHEFINRMNDKSILKHMTFTPHVYALNYDWSESILDELNYREVQKQTRSILKHSGCKAYMYVTHSMGGLVALLQMLYYPVPTTLEAPSNPHLEPKLLGTVAVAGPLQGAPETLRRVKDGVSSRWSPTSRFIANLLADEGWKCALLVPYVPGFADLFSFGDGVNVEKTALELISEHFHATNEVRSFIFGVDKCWSFGNQHKDDLVAQMKKNIAMAKALHDKLLFYLDDWRELTVSVCLTGSKTLQSFSDNTTLNPILTDGDGTVPKWSQIYNCCKAFYVKEQGIDHGDALSNEAVFPYIYNAMNFLFIKNITRDA
jgi:hypothetical protein